MATDSKIASIERATNRSWDQWLRFLDSVGGRDLSHKDIALKVHEELDGTMDSAGWWAQSIAVAYEHHIGRRVPGQRSDGTFQLSVSRSTALGLKELMARWSEFAAGNATVQLLLAEPPKTGGSDRRLTWRSRARDGSSVLVTSEPKKNGTASIVASQMGLPSPEANDAAREQWVKLLTAFLERL
ncbi:hypothetical protein SAMN04488693_11256 [Arthrobacter subterraneus]|uniref:Activator of Hsp90 ATPase homolog 1-like protein n=1 Tax=Arthrobacter subterraneus TaxID=335973 RepID=A0A1G8KW46_9MICC|nr:hypothetical protein [Arthrobacter subterraneus]SDI47678.1 hypothetical protein SAMN04488693_11256 [Arthrobacter subterraneus]